MTKIQVTVVKGPVTVAYRQEEGKWYAIALEFDLVGIGKTREAAFNELRDIVNDYLIDCMAEKKPVEFFFPSEPDEWNVEDKEWYSVTALSAQPVRGRSRMPSSINMSQLHSFRNRIKQFDLIPQHNRAGACSLA